MVLSDELVEAAKRGETVRVTADDVEIVVLRADLFDSARQDDVRMTYPAVLRAWDRDENPDDYADYLHPK